MAAVRPPDALEVLAGLFREAVQEMDLIRDKVKLINERLLKIAKTAPEPLNRFSADFPDPSSLREAVHQMDIIVSLLSSPPVIQEE